MDPRESSAALMTDKSDSGSFRISTPRRDSINIDKVLAVKRFATT